MTFSPLISALLNRKWWVGRTINATPSPDEERCSARWLVENIICSFKCVAAHFEIYSATVRLSIRWMHMDSYQNYLFNSRWLTVFACRFPLLQGRTWTWRRIFVLMFFISFNHIGIICIYLNRAHLFTPWWSGCQISCLKSDSTSASLDQNQLTSCLSCVFTTGWEAFFLVVFITELAVRHQLQKHELRQKIKVCALRKSAAAQQSFAISIWKFDGSLLE